MARTGRTGRAVAVRVRRLDTRPPHHRLQDAKSRILAHHRRFSPKHQRQPIGGQARTENSLFLPEFK